MSNVNKQMLDVLVQLAIAETGVINAKAWSAGEQAKKHCDFALTAIATARQAIAAAEQAQQADPVAWKHDCAALLMNDVELWARNCPHCGKPRAAQPPAVVVPEGYALVPIEPTQAMLDAGQKE